MKKPLGAVAVDLGASSARFAAGTCVEGRIEFEVIKQIPHAALQHEGHDVWDLEKLLGLVREAIDYAEAHYERSAVGIDAWGVDHGFLTESGALAQPPICYRDASHTVQFERFADHRSELFRLTGIAAQPFNTIYQLAARKAEGMPHHTWLPLPDLLGYLVGGTKQIELTEASTTGLLGLDGEWCEEAFRLIDWPVPAMPATPPMVSPMEPVRNGVYLTRVGGHDTASAVYGLGHLEPGTMFLNVGTWALAGVVLDHPLASPAAEAAGFTNERTVEGKVRFLKNVPGFFIVNRIHADLGIAASVPEWLATATAAPTVDLMDPLLYNPDSMIDAIRELGGLGELSHAEWAGLAIQSLASTIANQIGPLEALIESKITTIRLSGGGSQSSGLCSRLAKAAGRRVVAGPAEATVLGNLAVSLRALESEEFDLSGSNKEYLA